MYSVRQLRAVKTYPVVNCILLLVCIASLVNNYNNYNRNRRVPNDRVSNGLLDSPKRVRILCLIAYNFNYTNSALIIKRTWARHCSRVLFVSGGLNDELEPYVPQENATDMWTLVKSGFSYAYQYHRHEADWFLKVKDNRIAFRRVFNYNAITDHSFQAEWSEYGFVVVENLRALLVHHTPETPIYFGCRAKDIRGQSFMWGDAGYVLSKEALRRFTKVALQTESLCYTNKSHSEDVEMGRCLHNVGVLTGDSRDEFGHHTFLPFTPEIHATNGLSVKPWFAAQSFYPVVNNTYPMSNHAISFPVEYPPVMYNYYYFIYKVKIFGMRPEITN